jgi:NADH-quinone oxidoreductase E subunit
VARLNPQNVERAKAIVARYPRARSAMIPLLHLTQEQDGHITPEGMEHVGELVGATAAEVRGVATFYEMFKHEEVGTYLLGVCTNLSCMLLGADELLEHAEKALGIKAGSTTADGTFTIEEMQCLAACGGAPCIQVNYRYFENLTHDRFDGIVEDLRAGRDPEGQAIPPHGTLSRISAQLPVPATPADRERPEEIHPPAAPQEASS